MQVWPAAAMYRPGVFNKVDVTASDKLSTKPRQGGTYDTRFFKLIIWADCGPERGGIYEAASRWGTTPARTAALTLKRRYTG